MNPESWQQLDQLFHSALAHQPSERAAFLDAACGSDDSLHKEVEALLAAHNEAGSFIESPALEVEARSVAADQDKLTAGQTIGHYRIISLLGAGGMGEVYLAEDLTLGREVALKLLPNDFIRDLDRVHRFQQEAHAASALNHPNIVTIHEVGHSDDRHFIATEFIDGETLRQYLSRVQSHIAGEGNGKSESRLLLREILNLAIQTADALAAAHEAGIVHRDIKPENIMVRRRDGYIKVLDFGLAKLTEGVAAEVNPEGPTRAPVQTSDGLVMGTVTYMSPEQTRGETVDVRTDIWSLGVVLYEMVAGCPPFDRKTFSEVIALILEREPPPLTRYVREVPVELERIVSKALTKKREERYQTAKDLLVDLRHLQQLEIQGEIDCSATGSAQLESAKTAEQPTARKTSSAEYIVGQIKTHTRGIEIAIAALFIVAATASYFYFRRSNRATINSMAVMPFVNVGADPNTEYLSDGLTDSLINSLSEMPNLRMVARNSVFLYKERQTDLQTIGRELGVQAILTGRVEQHGENLLISVELVDAQDKLHLWGEQYDRKTSDLLAVRQELAREITEKLRLRLAGEDEKRLTRGDAANAEAYQFYLKGRYFWEKRTAPSLKKAIEQFQQAIDKDPNYALAYVGLADSYGLLERYSGAPSSETLPKARAAAARALEIDDSLAEAHASLGLIEQYSWNFSATDREYKRALDLNPNYPTAHLYYGYYLQMVRGKFDEAMVEMKRARQLDPFSPYVGMNLATIYAAKGELDAAIEEAKKVLDLDANFFPAHAVLSFVYRRQGRYQEAIAEFENYMKPGQTFASLGVCYALAGNRAKAQAILKEVEERYDRHEALGQQIAEIYAALGEKDQAFAWLEKDFQARSGSLAFIAYDAGRYTLSDALSSDPRWNDLLRRIGLRQT